MARRHDFAGRCDRDRQGPRRSGIRTFTRSGFPRAVRLLCTTWTSGDVRRSSSWSSTAEIARLLRLTIPPTLLATADEVNDVREVQNETSPPQILASGSG